MKEILGKDTEWVGVNLSELLSDEQVKVIKLIKYIRYTLSTDIYLAESIC